MAACLGYSSISQSLLLYYINQLIDHSISGHTFYHLFRYIQSPSAQKQRELLLIKGPPGLAEVCYFATKRPQLSSQNVDNLSRKREVKISADNLNRHPYLYAQTDLLNRYSGKPNRQPKQTFKKDFQTYNKKPYRCEQHPTLEQTPTLMHCIAFYQFLCVQVQ